MDKARFFVGAVATALCMTGCGAPDPSPTPSSTESTAASPSPSPDDAGITPEAPVASPPTSEADWVPMITGSAPLDADAQRWADDDVVFFLPGSCAEDAEDGRWTCVAGDATGHVEASHVDDPRSAREVLREHGGVDVVDVEVPGAAQAAIARTVDTEIIMMLAVRDDDDCVVLTWAAPDSAWGPLGLVQSIESVSVES